VIGQQQTPNHLILIFTTGGLSPTYWPQSSWVIFTVSALEVVVVVVVMVVVFGKFLCRAL